MPTLAEYTRELQSYALSVSSDDILLQVRKVGDPTPFLMYWNAFGCVLFQLSETAEFLEIRPEVYPIERFSQIHYVKKWFERDRLSFDFQDGTYQFEVPHRSKMFEEQKRQVQLMRAYAEKKKGEKPWK